MNKLSKRMISCELTVLFSLYFRLFEGNSLRKIEKLKTLLCYFRRVTKTSKFSEMMLQQLILCYACNAFQFSSSDLDLSHGF